MRMSSNGLSIRMVVTVNFDSPMVQPFVRADILVGSGTQQFVSTSAQFRDLFTR